MKQWFRCPSSEAAAVARVGLSSAFAQRTCKLDSHIRSAASWRDGAPLGSQFFFFLPGVILFNLFM